MVTFYNKATATLKKTYNFTSWVDRVTYSKNGKYIAVAGTLSTVTILNSTTYALVATLNTNLSGTVYKVDFRYDDKMILTCGYNNVV